MDFEGRLGIEPVQGLTFGVGALLRQARQRHRRLPAKHTAERINALIDWKNDRFGIGVEYFQAKNWKNVDTDTTDKADGYSIWAHFDPAQDLTVFLRYDDAKPSKTLAPDRKLTYYNLGIQKKFNKVLAASLAYKYAEGKGGVTGTSNGSVGSTVAGAKGKYSEIGAWFVYNF